MRAKVAAGLLTATVGACVLVPTASAFAAPGAPGAPRPAPTTIPKQDTTQASKQASKQAPTRAPKRDDGEKGSRSAATSLTITALTGETANRSRRARAAKQLTLSGSLTSGRSGLAAQTVAVYFRKAGSARYTYVASARTGSRGQYSVKVDKWGAGTWKAAFAGTSGKRQSSATVNVA
ncbi:hypothetical protein AB0O28_16085 [Microbispora sp. NPDC088329]|uniref:hypothetical protein n=1 Tax=Microbispora sp. NPDC088329 TaxID=3154869 RepID=UPI0034159974